MVWILINEYIEPQKLFRPKSVSLFIPVDNVAGYFPSVLDQMNIKKKVFGFVISIPEVLVIVDEVIDYHKIPKFPSSTRDLSMMVPTQYMNIDVEKIIHDAAGDNLESLYLFDLYQGEQVKEGFKSMAYKLSFRAADRTLTDAEVDQWVNNIVNALAKAGINLRA